MRAGSKSWRSFESMAEIQSCGKSVIALFYSKVGKCSTDIISNKSIITDFFNIRKNVLIQIYSLLRPFHILLYFSNISLTTSFSLFT